MAKCLRTWFVLLSCLHLCVGVDALLQVVAWSRMLVDYTTQTSLAEGVTMTFDGQHPCCMCKAIAESRKQRQNKDDELPDLISIRLVLKEFVSPGNSEVPVPQAVDFSADEFVPLPAGSSLQGESPPVPPPRAFVV